MKSNAKTGLLGTLDPYLGALDCETEQTEALAKGYMGGVTKLKTAALL